MYAIRLTLNQPKHKLVPATDWLSYIARKSTRLLNQPDGFVIFSEQSHRFQGVTNEHRHNHPHYSYLGVSGRVAYVGAQQQLGVRTQRRHRADCYHSDSPAPTRQAVSDHQEIRGTFATRHKHARLASPRRDRQIWDYQRVSGSAVATGARHHGLQLECEHRVHRPQASRRFTRFDLVGRGTADARALQSGLVQTEGRAPHSHCGNCPTTKSDFR